MRLKNGKGKNMRLIDADVLKQHIDKLPALPDGNFAGNHSALKALINMQPTVDAVPVVRCRDCEHKDRESGFCHGRGWPMQLVPDDGFCDKGKER